MKKISYIFGPVPSRRLGRSLGIDMVPCKRCSYDCIYCQLGRTTDLTHRCGIYYDPEAIMAEFRSKLKEINENADYITLSGSGEPTLNSGLGAVISEVKKLSPVPVAVLTNGSMLWKEEVRNALLGADLVVPSLDAGTEKVFRAVNRPAAGLDFDTITAGLETFSHMYNGKIWVEVFLLEGISDTEEEVSAIAGRLEKVRCDRIQLNTVARPAAESFARPLSRAKMEQLLRLMPDNAEVIADFFFQERSVFRQADEESVLSLLERRPCTKEEISSSLSMHLNEIVKMVEVLEKSSLIESEEKGGKIYYFAAGKRGEAV